MEIFGIGPWELLLLALIAFIVLGPERIPQVARTAGRLVRQLRQMTDELTGEFRGDIEAVTGDIADVQRELGAMRRDLDQAVKTVAVQPPSEPATSSTPPPSAPSSAVEESPDAGAKTDA